jgi:CRP/FNR family nitrogen fixation transcriptional regulator
MLVPIADGYGEAVPKMRPGCPAWRVITGDGKDLAKPDEDLGILRHAGVVLNFGRNETIFSEGDVAENIYRVVSGIVRLCKLLPDGRRQIADFFLPGDFFGLIELETYAFSAEAVCPVTVLRYTRRHFEQLRDENRDLRNRIMTTLTRRLVASQIHAVLLGRRTVKERIAAFLLQLAERGNREAQDGDCLDLPMGRQDVADYLGLTIETVCRALGEMKRAGLICVPNAHRVVLNDVRTLRAIVDVE